MADVKVTVMNFTGKTLVDTMMPSQTTIAAVRALTLETLFDQAPYAVVLLHDGQVLNDAEKVGAQGLELNLCAVLMGMSEEDRNRCNNELISVLFDRNGGRGPGAFGYAGGAGAFGVAPSSEQRATNFGKLPLAVRKDDEIVLAAMRWSQYVMKYAHPNQQTNKEFVLKAMAVNGRALEFVPDDLKCDDDVVKAAMQQDKRAVMYASGDAYTQG